jgi:hypothetical protein
MHNERLSDLGHYLVEGSLSDARVLAKTGQEPPLSILPKAHVLIPILGCLRKHSLPLLTSCIARQLASSSESTT